LAVGPAAASLPAGWGSGAGFESDEFVGVAVRLAVEKVGVVGEGLPLVVEDGFLEAADAGFSVSGRGLLLLVAVAVDGLADPV
jgi:hypothetical protein